jgi:hypothetical protein
MSRSEEFDAGYRMQHQPFEASRFHEADKAYPDIYEHPEYYKTSRPGA